MKNEAALKSMAKMIQAMLPYEPDYEPTSLGTVCLSEMFESLKTHSPEIVEIEGVFNYILKQMDASDDTGKFDRALMRVWAIIHKYYPPLEKGGHSLQASMPPVENDPNYIKLEWSDKKQGFEEVDSDVVFKVVE